MRRVVTVAVLAAAVLMALGLLVSAVPRWRESASRLRCQDHLRQVGWFALWDYTDRATVFAGPERPRQLDGIQPAPGALFPPGTLPNAELPPEKCLSQYVVLLPHLNQADPAGRFDPKQAWDAGPNAEAARTLLPVLVCPSYYQPGLAGVPALTHYVGSTGLGPDSARLPPEHPRAGLFRYDGRTSVAQVRDGLSFTMVLTETAWQNGPWAAGGPPTLRGVDPDRQPYLGAGRPFGGTHPGGVNVIFCDGSVRFVADTVTPAVFEAYATIAGDSQPAPP
jgi:prepilin-type processing-associated H-X9-DG protein